MQAGPARAGHPGPRDLTAIWILAFAAASLIGTHGLAYWDAGDYVLLAVQGGKSGLLLGRPLFLWTSQAVLALGVDVAHAEPVLRWFWSAVSACAAPLMAVLGSRLFLGRGSAIAAGAALALSPSFAHTSHQVLTDGPALAISIAALIAAADRRAVLAGLLLAAAIATRETSAIHLVAVGMLLGRSALRGVTVCAIAVVAIVVAYEPPGVMGWLGAMSQSAATHRWSPRDVGISVAWVLAAGPAAVTIGLLAIIKGESSRRLNAVAIPALVGTVLLLFYPDGSFSPRYVLATAPLAFFLIAAPRLSMRPALTIIALAVPLAVAYVAAGNADTIAHRGSTLMQRIPELPAEAVVVPGHFCPQARLAAASAGRGDLRFLCTGWSWPADPARELEAALEKGHPVAIDIDDDAWIGTREVGPRDQVRAWVQARPHQSVAGFIVVTK